MRKTSQCSCGKVGKFKREGICSACFKEDNRVYNPEKQKQYFDKWYKNQQDNGYPSYDWKLRNAKQKRPEDSIVSVERTE